MAGLLALALIVGACGANPDPESRAGEVAPEQLAFGDAERNGNAETGDPSGSDASTTATNRPDTQERPGPSTTVGPIELGTVDNPFVQLPPTGRARAVMTSTGVVVPVIDERPNSWLVSTPCQNIAFVTDGQPIGRAHVVLDPGHGGVEYGAVGSTGITEKDLNLRVALATAEILEQAGATVVLARTGDYTITAASRGLVAKAIDPALLVSIHHNGGAPAGGERPGTMVYTKTGSAASTRFGGLLHQTLQPMLRGAAEPSLRRYRDYSDALDAHDAAIAAYDRSVADRDAVLVANGQIPADATTVPPTTARPAPGEPRLPSVRQPITTTTAPPTTSADGVAPIPVPEPPIPPPPFTLDVVRPFSWAGSGNAGVRSWTRADGRDYLAVLRHSGAVPAVLAEFLYVTNPAEEELLADPGFIEAEAGVLADAIVLYFTTRAEGTGHVADQFDDQPIGGSGGIDDCVEPEL